MHESLVFVGVSPHPPIIVPEIGGTRLAEAARTVEGVRKVMRRLVARQPESTVLISPHAPFDPRAFPFYSGQRLQGDFGQFGAPQVSCDVANDPMLLSRIAQLASEAMIPVHLIHAGRPLDHGAMVPLYFLLEAGYQGRLVITGLSLLSSEMHLKFGEVIAQAAEGMKLRYAIIASGDMSHRLKPGAPAGYSASAHIYDERIVDCVTRGAVAEIVGVDADLRETAAEDIYHSLLIALGATGKKVIQPEVCSYEGPFGVGYMSAVLFEPLPAEVESDPLVDLARDAVGRYVRSREVMDAKGVTAITGRERAGVFVCIKTRGEELRGCVGTTMPTCSTLGEEIVQNAIGAACRDPRFPPIEPSEIDQLKFTVDVLSSLEIVDDPAQLDPRRYGVLVEDPVGQRGLLLPDLPGMNTVEEQLIQARKKAGIPESALVKMWRFTVERHTEKTGSCKDQAN